VTAYLTEEESLERKKTSMGSELGELYWELCKELSLLHMTWSEYRALFATSEANIKLLNSAAPQFFYTLDCLMWHDVLMHICRLTDPPKSGGRKNLCLARLPLAIGEPNLEVQVSDLVAQARADGDFARDWRNRHLAHRDLAKAQNPEAHALAGASREKVETSLASMAAVLNCVLGHYDDAMHDYRASHVSYGGSASLLRVLRAGASALREVDDDGPRG
jgi:hypothetical protein